MRLPTNILENLERKIHKILNETKIPISQLKNFIVNVINLCKLPFHFV